jgi:hypothetical protein
MGLATTVSASVGNGVYHVRVVAANSAGAATSNEITFNVGATAPPGVPTLNPATVSAGRSVTLTWSAGSGGPVASYTIVARALPNGPIIASLPGVPGTTLTVPAPPGTYLVNVIAVNALGSSAESNQITVVVP